ncbi:XK-related protein 6-like [Centruroides vittatus]|uniref:XK-related protein 6-like n=1 Tax=Centruroides vittatus TaxID=120091 RepID=UPI0035101FF1
MHPKESPRNVCVNEQSQMEPEDGKEVKPNEQKFEFTIFEIFGGLLSIGTFLFDTGMDGVVAYRHYTKGDIKYFILTVVFIVVPALTMTCFSIWMYKQDVERLKECNNSPSRLRQCIRIVLHVLQLGPLLRYIDSLIYGIKCWKSKDKEFYHSRMRHEGCDAAFLRLLEAFMEAAPQVILQTYIIVKNSLHDPNYILTVKTEGFSILTSLISLPWALASYHRFSRFCLPHKQNILWKGTIVQLLWHFFTISSRVFSLSLLATLSPVILGIGCFCHWLMMTCWIISMKTSFYENKFQEIMYNAILGIVFIFCYYNPIDSQTRYRYVIYFIVTFIENTTIIILWYYYIDPLPWFYLYVMVIIGLSFFIGIFFMILYYLTLHPTGKISIWRKPNSTYDQNNENIPMEKV